MACATLVLALENLQVSSGAAPGTTSGSKKSPAPEASDCLLMQSKSSSQQFERVISHDEEVDC